MTVPRLASMFRSDKVSKLLKCFDGKMNVETYIDYPLRGALISAVRSLRCCLTVMPLLRQLGRPWLRIRLRLRLA